jgi:hypothetical protein
LYYEIQSAFTPESVIHHARPQWLGKQHLDVFIPSSSVAIEYQGLQHDQPVEYFGGMESFQRQAANDEKKKRLCVKNGIRLIYVKPNYDLHGVLKEIRTAP